MNRTHKVLTALSDFALLAPGESARAPPPAVAGAPLDHARSEGQTNMQIKTQQ